MSARALACAGALGPQATALVTSTCCRGTKTGDPMFITGVRIVVTLANELRRRSARYGLVSICGAGATAVAMILERP